jgi:hypothetical protein
MKKFLADFKGLDQVPSETRCDEQAGMKQLFTIQYGEDLIEKLPINGNIEKDGIVVEDKYIQFQNTCSIDYFLLVCFIVSRRFEEKIKKKDKKTELDNLLLGVLEALTVNDWNKARYVWRCRNKFIEVHEVIFGNLIFIDCYSDENNAFNSAYTIFQEYTWKMSCPRVSCLTNKTIPRESSFKLVLVKK